MRDEPQQPTGAFTEGADSYLKGLSRENCPYPPDSTEREEWLAGWDQTAADQPRV